jgi:HEPN domain-containing protein
MRQDVERLLLQARRDLENARKNVGIEAHEVAAFLAHQSVEKCLNAAWIHRRRSRPPATRYLKELGDGLGIPRRLLGHLLFLNPDYTVARYPDAANGVPFARKRRELGIVSLALEEGLRLVSSAAPGARSS